MGKRTCKNTENVSKNEWVNSKHLLGSESIRPYLLTFLQWKYFLLLILLQQNKSCIFSPTSETFPLSLVRNLLARWRGRAKVLAVERGKQFIKIHSYPCMQSAWIRFQLRHGMRKLPSNKASRFWLLPCNDKIMMQLRLLCGQKLQCFPLSDNKQKSHQPWPTLLILVKRTSPINWVSIDSRSSEGVCVIIVVK